METFKAKIELIGINPYVLVPDQLLVQIFAEANKEKGPIPVYGSVNGINYQQTLVKYKGSWRLYINTTMLPDSTKRIGEIIDVAVAFDRRDRTLAMHTGLEKALKKIPAARKIFIQLPPSLQKEINRYLFSLKTEKAMAKNIDLAIGFLLGKNRFIGRDPRS